ncbi:MAG: SAM-dependent chlorinase/fluorinase [Crocinitomicaceae bacterium]|nr:SAM-dependent chlorinase/fluorinase [Flavobacteriales bacterium]NQZ38126.1 SAM-dependent chlorinase/fluorinase [Crocinitomicaceae bacterium]
MKVITLTTDMGLHDHYVASLKGTILRSLEEAKIIDISHSVRPFDIAEAAYHVRSCFQDLPKGTVHVIGVDSEPIINFGGSDGSFPAIMLYEGQYFVSCDNGFFGAFLGENRPESFWRMEDILSNEKLFTFPTKNVLLPAAIRILNNEDPSTFAVASKSYKSALTPTAITETNLIKGYVIHIDNYGNAITNIDRSLFTQFGEGAPFVVYFKKKDYYIDVISEAYNEVPQGEKVAIFNANNLLEIAINRGANGSTGGAEQLFGLRINDMIRVEFTPKGSRTTIESLF